MKTTMIIIIRRFVKFIKRVWLLFILLSIIVIIVPYKVQQKYFKKPVDKIIKSSPIIKTIIPKKEVIKFSKKDIIKLNSMYE